jgi:hypothetical protein
MTILLRYLPLRGFRYAVPCLGHDGQVLIHIFRARLHLEACAQLLKVPHSLGERPRERLQELFGL